MPSSRFLTLDALRGLACLLVVAFHSIVYEYDSTNPVIRAVRWGWVGVPMFFVISGYCIAATGDNSRRKQHGFVTFMRRRVRRIFPPYLICFVLTLLVVRALPTVGLGWLIGNDDGPHLAAIDAQLTKAQLAGNLTLTETWRPYVWPVPGKWLIGTAWTLGYEEQFYLIVALLILLAPKHFFAGVVVVSLAILPLFGQYLGLFFHGEWLEFACGVLVYYATNYGRRPLWAVAPLVIAAIGFAPFGTDAPNDLCASISIAAAFAALLIPLKLRDETAAGTLPFRLLAPFGVMCYSLYLVHWPLVRGVSHALHAAGLRGWQTVGITIPICLLVAAAVAAVFYWAVERRFLNARTIAPPAHHPERLADPLLE